MTRNLNSQCKVCAREIKFSLEKKRWLATDPDLMFPQYCGFPWPPNQEHEPVKEKRRDTTIHNIQVLKPDV